MYGVGWRAGLISHNNYTIGAGEAKKTIGHHENDVSVSIAFPRISRGYCYRSVETGRAG